MFYDMNVPYSPDDPEILHTLEFLAELGYTTVALSQTITGKIPPNATPPSPPANAPKSLTLLSRVNIPLADPSQNQRLTALAETYSLVAVRPTNEKSLLNACNNLDCDLISLDFSERLPFHFKFKTLASAISRGVRFEICYGPGVTGSGLEARRNLIGNAMALIRATRGRGIIISSEAKRALGVRAPWDVINLACVWGLSQERGKEAICEEARKVTALAKLKRSSWRGIVDVVHGGEKPKVEPAKTKKSAPAVSDAADSLKRKASLSSEPPAEESEKPLSKPTASSPRPNNAIVNALWSATVLISNGSAVAAAAPPASAVALVVDVVDVAVVKVVLAAAAVVVVAAAVVSATNDEDVAAEVDCCTAAELEACTAVLLSVWAATLLEEGTATLEDITAGVEPATTALDAGVMMVANVDARAAAELDGYMLKALAGQRQVQSQAPESDPALPAGVAAGTATADDDAATAAEDMAGVLTPATDDDAAIAATDDDAATAATEDDAATATTEDDDVSTAATDDDAAAAATEDDVAIAATDDDIAIAATDDDAAAAATDDDAATAATDDDVATTATDDDAATA
ncbi:hypothetical protein DTO021D3_1339 [Paecilomyces variotii]|nr:hypothetical protein DTO032I3_2305 [Paecilomyces variotii]KAJ9282043.1 hypothetical protein DTO021D3_1339 [Paecilomyces variotii]KAJ9286182.1 hypothetical protein DTO021C3_6260 [Paecilomyces variotii]KAJ9342046.1 hypothetical protein DTO027B6_5493 [Paecilomyces variotii]KAJ9388483.1 hypothetical protein DTO032I4_2453 [Paecilomyces variotii]